MMSHTIRAVLIISVFLYYSAGPTSHASSISEGSGSIASLSVDGSALERGERDIVHGHKILAKANFYTGVVTPFKNLGKFRQYKRVENPEPHHNEQFVPINVTPQQWLDDIRAYSIANNKRWIYESAHGVLTNHVVAGFLRKEEERLRVQQNLHRQIQNHLSQHKNQK